MAFTTCCDSMPKMPPAACENVKIDFALSAAEVFEAIKDGRLFYKGTAVKSVKHLKKLYKKDKKDNPPRVFNSLT